MSTVAAKGKSSLMAHVFPSFYSCYLLKSAHTPRSAATYIGSTPDPPRRLRQHNGELTQGAWKTRRGRPWVMQMIVYGFPSKLAALQFEWAWQHPAKSRHLRDGEGNAIINEGKGNRYLKTNVQIVRTMLMNHPYNTWPLNVKLFTDGAVRAWNEAGKAIAKGKNGNSDMPPGLLCSTELEGVDGKSGQDGLGRKEPIEVRDEQFTTRLITKNKNLLSSGVIPKCTICKQTITNYSIDPLSSTLCTNPICTATSHITCLSSLFLASSSLASSSDASATLVPRGGQCPECQTYVLWGDVVRGMYRRKAGRVFRIEEEEAEDDGMEEENESGPEVYGDDESASDSSGRATGVIGGVDTDAMTPATQKRKAPELKSATARGKEKESAPPPAGRPSKKRAGTKDKESSATKKSKSTSKDPSKKRKQAARLTAAHGGGESEEGEYFDVDGVSSTDESDEAEDLLPTFGSQKQKKKPASAPAPRPRPRPRPRPKALVPILESTPGSLDPDVRLPFKRNFKEYTLSPPIPAPTKRARIDAPASTMRPLGENMKRAMHTPSSELARDKDMVVGADEAERNNRRTGAKTLNANVPLHLTAGGDSPLSSQSPSPPPPPRLRTSQEKHGLILGAGEVDFFADESQPPLPNYQTGPHRKTEDDGDTIYLSDEPDVLVEDVHRDGRICNVSRSDEDVEGAPKLTRAMSTASVSEPESLPEYETVFGSQRAKIGTTTRRKDDLQSGEVIEFSD